MIWLAVDEDGDEVIFEEKPLRSSSKCWCSDSYGSHECCIYLPKGSIEKLLGRPLTWEDEPAYVADSE